MKRLKKIGVISAFCALIMLFVSCDANQETIYVYNWGGYISDRVCEDFKKETGITVKYDTFDTNETMYTIVKNNEGAYDVLFPSEYMIQRMIGEGMLEKLDLSKIPEIINIDERFKNLPADPNNEYMVPFIWGTVGILYNKTMVDDPVDSWNILWDKKYEKKIFMLESTRDSIGLALKKLNPNYSMNTTNMDELAEAKKTLLEQYPLTLSYVGDTVKDKMIANEAALAVVYSGDAMYSQSLNKDLDYAIPKEGSNIWFDGMVIPKGAQNMEGALKFINYMCRADIAAENSAYIGYTTSNRAALEFVDEETRSNPIYWPDDETLARCEMFLDLGNFKEVYDEIWVDVLIGQE